MKEIGKTVLEVKHATKRFPGVTALDDVSFDLRAGEVHILVGENGAGKSTLAKIILGAHIPEEGEIYLHGEKQDFKSSKDALEKGISSVYQEFNLVPYLNVAQNIFFAREYNSNIPGIVDSKKMHKEAKELLLSLGVDYIDTKRRVKYLSVAEQQMVEIAKALSTDPKIIIFDEPTAALSEREVKAFFEKIHQLKKAGIAIVYVSHRLYEFEQIGDRMTVLRDGKYIGTENVGEISDDDLVKMMVGRDISQVYVRTPNDHTEEVLRTEGLSNRNKTVKNANIRVNKGEIVGLAGLVGAGRTELANMIFGIDKPASGKVFIHGEEVIPNSPHQMRKKGIGLLPEDRKKQGLATRHSIAWNVLTVSLRDYFPKFFVSDKKLADISNQFIKDYNIKTSGSDKVVKFLSGGNQQKVVVAKWLSADSDIIIFDEPTRGIDVGAKMEIYALMDALALQGKAIIMISSELPEVIGLSDRLYVMYEGDIVGEYVNDELTIEEIGSKMMLGDGIKDEQKAI